LPGETKPKSTKSAVVLASKPSHFGFGFESNQSIETPPRTAAANASTNPSIFSPPTSSTPVQEKSASTNEANSAAAISTPTKPSIDSAKQGDLG
jgi:hypothetical protein